MNVTELKATLKRCCGPAGCGQEDTNDGQRYCIGSSCMAWRWTEPMFEGPNSYVSEPGPTGYCGRAGKPIN